MTKLIIDIALAVLICVPAVGLLSVFVKAFEDAKDAGLVKRK